MKMNHASLTEHKRPAFSLVELMVAMAIIILMMSIMSQAFVIATTVMQGLKDATEMQLQVRPALNMLQRDLGSYHFEGTKKLSDPDFWDNGPPNEGYFMVWQEYPHDVQTLKSATTGLDVINFGAQGAMALDGIANAVTGSTTPLQSRNGNIFSTNHPGYESETASPERIKYRRSGATANHMLAFTVKLGGESPEKFFQAKYPNFPTTNHLLFNKNYLFNNNGVVPIGMASLNSNDVMAGYPNGLWAASPVPTEYYNSNVKRFENASNYDYVHSQWAEVAYFLGGYYDKNKDPASNGYIYNLKSPGFAAQYPNLHTSQLAMPVETGTTSGNNSGNTPLKLFTLYRQQKLVMPNIGKSPTSVTVGTNIISGDNPRIMKSGNTPIYAYVLPSLNMYLEQSSIGLVQTFKNLMANFSTWVVPFAGNNANINISADSGNGVYAGSAKMAFNTPRDLTIPYRRMGNRDYSNLGMPQQIPATNPPQYLPLYNEYTRNNSNALEYTDVIATNVISFDVRLLTDDRLEFEDLYSIQNQNQVYYTNPTSPTSANSFQYLPYKMHPGSYSYSHGNAMPNSFRAVFDTWTKYSSPAPDKYGTPTVGLGTYDSGDYSTGKWQPNTHAYFDSVNGTWARPNNFTSNTGIIPMWRYGVFPTNTDFQSYPVSGLKVRAIQISLRLWDSKANVARQYVLVQRL